MNAIEEGRQRLIEQGEIDSANREVFNTAIEILKAKGVKHRGDYPFNTYKVLRYTDKSMEPEILIVIRAGNDLAKARKIDFFIGGKGWLYFKKSGAEGREQFDAYQSLMPPAFPLTSHNETSEIPGYRDAIRQVKKQLGLHE